MENQGSIKVRCMETKVFSGTVRSALKECLDAGFVPANMKTVWKLRKEGKIENTWYDTGTIFIDGEIRDATLEELRDIEALYEKGARLLCLGCDYSGVLDLYLLSVDGRFLGVRWKKKGRARGNIVRAKKVVNRRR